MLAKAVDSCEIKNSWWHKTLYFLLQTANERRPDPMGIHHNRTWCNGTIAASLDFTLKSVSMFHYDQINDQSPLFDQSNNSSSIRFNNALKYIANEDISLFTNQNNSVIPFSDQEFQQYVELLKFANLTLKRYKTRAQGTSTCFCNSDIRAIGDIYKSEIHGVLSLMVCTFGIVANLLNIVVLTHKELSATPINRILTGLAVTDLLVMLEYVPFSIYMYFVHVRSKLYFTYAGSLFILIHMHFSQLLHTISIFQTLTLAICRHVAIRWVMLILQLNPMSTKWCMRWQIQKPMHATDGAKIILFSAFLESSHNNGSNLFWILRPHEWIEVACNTHFTSFWEILNLFMKSSFYTTE